MAANLAGWLNDNSQALYQSRLLGMASPMSRFWGNRYNDIYGEYLGQQALQAQMGQFPTGNFGSFLSDFPWLQRYQGFSPQQRGYYPSRLAPPTRRLNY